MNVVNVKRFAAVVNPHGGLRRGADVLARLKPVFIAASVELHEHYTEHRNRVTLCEMLQDFWLQHHPGPRRRWTR